LSTLSVKIVATQNLLSTQDEPIHQMFRGAISHSNIHLRDGALPAFFMNALKTSRTHLQTCMSLHLTSHLAHT